MESTIYWIYEYTRQQIPPSTTKYNIIHNTWNCIIYVSMFQKLFELCKDIVACSSKGSMTNPKISVFWSLMFLLSFVFRKKIIHADNMNTKNEYRFFSKQKYSIQGKSIEIPNMQNILKYRKKKNFSFYRLSYFFALLFSFKEFRMRFQWFYNN